MGILRRLKDIPEKVYLRYLLLNLPGAALLVGILFLVRTRIDFPGWFIALLVAIWLVKDGVLFPFVCRSYDWDRPGISRTMTGSIGIVKKPLDPEGLVQIDGELWKAQNIGREEILARGAVVRVVKRSGVIRSVVRPAASGSQRAQKGTRRL
mgnify:CR=1 FL=1